MLPPIVHSTLKNAIAVNTDEKKASAKSMGASVDYADIDCNAVLRVLRAFNQVIEMAKPILVEPCLDDVPR